MKIFPSDRITFSSKLNEKEITSRIKANIDSIQSIIPRVKSKKINKDYQGEITKTGFRIIRTVEHRNSFQPEIKGTIESFDVITKVHLEFNLSQFVKGFMLVWLSIATIATIVTAISMFVSNSYKSFFSYIPFFLLAFGFALMNVAYNYEKKLALKYLSDLLDFNHSPTA